MEYEFDFYLKSEGVDFGEIECAALIEILDGDSDSFCFKVTDISLPKQAALPSFIKKQEFIKAAENYLENSVFHFDEIFEKADDHNQVIHVPEEKPYLMTEFV